MKQQQKNQFKEFLSYHFSLSLSIFPLLLPFTLLTPCFSLSHSQCYLGSLPPWPFPVAFPLLTLLSLSLFPLLLPFTLLTPCFSLSLSQCYLGSLPPGLFPVAFPLPTLLSLSFSSSLLFTCLSASLSPSCCLSSTTLLSPSLPVHWTSCLTDQTFLFPLYPWNFNRLLFLFLNQKL